MGLVKIRLLASLREEAGSDSIEVEADTWREALVKAKSKYVFLARAIDDRGNPRPGFLVFVDGVDSRIAEEGEAREIVVLPVNHGGVELFHVGWSDVEEGARIVAERLSGDGVKIDVVIGILRGGVLPARLISDFMGVEDLATMEVKLYTSPGTRRPRPYIRQPLTFPIYNKNVLIVDDVSDTGLTLEHAIEAVKLYSPKEVYTATIYVKPWTKLVPDYYAYITDKWIVFPWEKKETERAIKSVHGGTREA